MTTMEQVTHKELKELVRQYYNKKISLFIMGRFGIGKSESIASVANNIAIEKHRKFVNWNKLTEEEKHEVFNNPKDYFVLIDIRLSEYDSSDIKGLPIFKESNGCQNKAIEFKIPFWALLTTKPDSDGIVFFDEINLAPPLVMSSCYKIIYDRIINDMPISKNWGIFGAGNLDEDRAYTNSIAPPLKDRAGEVELLGATPDSWMEWALEHNINPKIIGYINFKNGALYKVDFNDKQKFTTYRGWGERVSRLLEGINEKDFGTIKLLCSSAIGEGVAQEFVAWLKISQEIDLPSIIAQPNKIKAINDISIKWFINTAIAEQYGNNKIKFEKLMEVSKALDEIDNVELVAYLWKMCAGLNKNFKKEFLRGVDDNLVKKYSKYLI